MSDFSEASSRFRKPRPDYPIYPSTGYYRKKAQTFKVPKGRKGRKPRGQRLVPRGQAQDFLIIKAEDEARKARELAIAQAKEQEQYRQLQIQDIEDKRADRQEEIQIRRDEAQARQDEAQARQDEAQARIDETRQLRLESDRREQRLIEDRREIEAQFVRLYEAQERRMGENLEIFERAFKAIADRRPVDFRDIKLQEQTDLTADQRRDRRGRSESFEREVSVGLESLAGTPKERRRTPTPERKRQVKQVLATKNPQSEPERQSIPIETIEQTTTKGRDVKLPKRYEEGATEAELAAAGGIEGQTPKPKPKTEQDRGGSGFTETKRRGAGSGKQTKHPQPEPEREEGTPVIGGDWLSGVKLSPATTGSLTESQVGRDLGAIAESVKAKKYGD